MNLNPFNLFLVYYELMWIKTVSIASGYKKKKIKKINLLMKMDKFKQNLCQIASYAIFKFYINKCPVKLREQL